MFLTLRGCRLRLAALLGFVHGVVFLLLFSFLRVFGPAGWLILGAAEALCFALLGGLAALVGRYRYAWLTQPAVWVLVEALRDRERSAGSPGDSWPMPRREA